MEKSTPDPALPSLFDGRVCKSCGLWKPLQKFKTQRKCVDGREPRCRSCSQDPEAKKRWDRAHYERNRERIIAQVTAAQQVNRPARLAYMSAWARDNRGRIREWLRKKLADPVERAKANVRSREWARRNPEKRRVLNLNAFAKRKRAAVGTWTLAEFAALCERYGNVCLCCGKGGKLEPDHVIPLIHGGPNDISNIQPLCRSCNARKWAKTIDYRPP